MQRWESEHTTVLRVETICSRTPLLELKTVSNQNTLVTVGNHVLHTELRRLHDTRTMNTVGRGRTLWHEHENRHLEGPSFDLGLDPVIEHLPLLELLRPYHLLLCTQLQLDVQSSLLPDYLRLLLIRQLHN